MAFLQTLLLSDDETRVSEGKTILLALGGTATGFSVLLNSFRLVGGDTAARLAVLAGGVWPEGSIQFLTYFAFVWAMLLLWGKALLARRDRRGFSLGLLPDDLETRLLPEDVSALRKRIRHLPEEFRRNPVVMTIDQALAQFRVNPSVADVAQMVTLQTETLLNLRDADMATVRYLAWSIPSIGFIGTVLGIGQALGHAEQAAENIGSVTSALNTAFDTTFVALVLSLVLMYVMHQVQRQEELLGHETQQYCLSGLVARLYPPSSTSNLPVGPPTGYPERR